MKKVLLFFLLICNFTFWSKEVLAKDYSITKADIKINLLADGSAKFSETRTYDFEGSFSWADQWIHLAPKCKNCVKYQITDVSLRDESRIYKQEQSENPNTFYYKIGEDFYIKWHYWTVNASKTFTLTYTSTNTITNHIGINLAFKNS